MSLCNEIEKARLPIQCADGLNTVAILTILFLHQPLHRFLYTCPMDARGGPQEISKGSARNDKVPVYNLPGTATPLHLMQSLC